MSRPPRQRNEFAELYVAGVFADHGWLIYFPREDKGFDFIITKCVQDVVLVRPVQVTGKYPETMKKRSRLGFDRKLTMRHPQMIIAVPFFSASVDLPNPQCIAYLPLTALDIGRNGFRCSPAKLENGECRPRPSYVQFFDADGLLLVGSPNWGGSA